MLKKITNKCFAIAHDDMISFLENDEDDDINCVLLVITLHSEQVQITFDEIDEMQFHIQLALVRELDELQHIETIKRDEIDEFDTICDDDDEVVDDEFEVIEHTLENLDVHEIDLIDEIDEVIYKRVNMQLDIDDDEVDDIWLEIDEIDDNEHSVIDDEIDEIDEFFEIDEIDEILETNEQAVDEIDEIEFVDENDEVLVFFLESDEIDFIDECDELEHELCVIDQ